jgi:DNA-binding MarR family transcriptional regulator
MTPDELKVLRAIVDERKGIHTPQNVARLTDLTWQRVTKVAAVLIRSGYIRKRGVGTKMISYLPTEAGKNQVIEPPF